MTTFHATLLTPYKETKEHGTNFTEPPPDLIDSQPEWEVEKVLGSRHRRNQLQYLIRWKGFSEAHDSWEPLTHINANHLIENFHQENPTTIRSTQIKADLSRQTAPILLCCTIMSSNPTPPLQSHIDDPSPTLTLAERLSDPEHLEPGSPHTQGSYHPL